MNEVVGIECWEMGKWKPGVGVDRGCRAEEGDTLTIYHSGGNLCRYWEVMALAHTGGDCTGERNVRKGKTVL